MDWNESSYDNDSIINDSYRNASVTPGGAVVEEDRLIDQIMFYFIPCIILIGCLGNIASVVVFNTTKLKMLSSSYYLSALAISDSGFLLSLGIVWMSMKGVNINLYNTQIWCQIVTYCTSVFSFLSVWYVVAFTIERYIAVCYPLHRPSMCTVSRAKMVTVSLFVIALLLYSYVIFVTDVIAVYGGQFCWINEDYVAQTNALNILDTVVTLVVPVILIATLNVLILRTIWQIERIRSDLTKTNLCQKRNKPKQHIQMTKMMLIISTTFVCLNFPSYVVRIWVYFVSQFDGIEQHSTELSYIMQQVSQLIFYTNFAINFMLYCLTGTNFRRALFTLCRGNKEAIKYGRDFVNRSTFTTSLRLSRIESRNRCSSRSSSSLVMSSYKK